MEWWACSWPHGSLVLPTIQGSVDWMYIVTVVYWEALLLCPGLEYFHKGCQTLSCMYWDQNLTFNLLYVIHLDLHICHICGSAHVSLPFHPIANSYLLWSRTLAFCWGCLHPHSSAMLACNFPIVSWPGSWSPSGSYLCRMSSGGSSFLQFSFKEHPGNSD